MESKDGIHKGFSSVFSRRNTWKRDKVSHFGKAVENNEIASEAVGDRKISNKIH